MIQAYQKLIDWLKGCGIKPRHHNLDNEVSDEMKEVIEENEMTYQLVPPHDHRRNIAKREIQTFKAHLLPSCVASTATSPSDSGVGSYRKLR